MYLISEEKKELSNERMKKQGWILNRQIELFNTEINDMSQLPS